MAPAANSADSARAELTAALERGFETAFPPQGSLADLPLRRSSVLILFGALDRVPADRDGSPVPADLDVLLTRRADHMRHHPGQIAFPGGGADPGDVDAVATALREASEETALDPAGVDVLGSLPEIHLPVSNNLVTPVLGWWRLPSEVAADHSESVEVFRVPVAELLDPAARGTSVATRGTTTYRGSAFELGPRFGGHIVWGFTARLLECVFDGVGWTRPWDRSRTFDIDLT